MNAVIYARYSSDSQREESIEGQLRECREYAERNNMTIVGTYIDRALSAKTADRPEFQHMIKDSAKELFEIVLVWKLDRFSRDKYDTAVYKSRLKKNGVTLYYSDQNIPDTPEGIILESLLEGFAQYYSANLSRNAKRGLQENARKCLWNGGGLPLGYTIDETKHFVIDPAGAACVRLIFQMYADNHSIKEIVSTLNEKGYRTVKGNKFRLGSIQGVLRNRKYIGEYHASGITVPNGVPAIVDVELFNAVQEKIGVVSTAKARNKAEIPYLLTTKVFCGHCGSPMIGESGTGKGGSTYRYYKCSCRKNRKGQCDKRTEQKEWLEETVVAQTVEKFLHPDVIEDVSNACAAVLEQDCQNNALLKALNAQLADVEKSSRNLIKAIEAGVFTASMRERLAELEQQKEDITVQIAREQLRKPQLSAEQIAFFLRSFLDGDAHDLVGIDRRTRIIERVARLLGDPPEHLFEFGIPEVQRHFLRPNRRDSSGSTKQHQK